ncbi:MAG: lytic transglycosylase domain-containing protein [Bacteriovoracaceae bacterium]
MSLLKRPPLLKMAPPGSHIVKRHVKVTSEGIKYYVKAHLRKNRGKKVVLLPENILYLYWHGDQDCPRIGAIKGYDEFSELDSVIYFWLNYWKEAGLPFPKDIDLLIIKTMIAVESSFKLKADPKVKQSSAYGLMQITDTTRKDAKNLRDEVIDLERKDLEDAVISIAMGIRWISYKYSSIPKKSDKNLFNTLRAYNDWQKGAPYAEKILAVYHAFSKK